MTVTLEQFQNFLRSLKTSETLTKELRPLVTVATGLEQALISALKNGRDVIIAGSAGGGKTHLIASLSDTELSNLPPLLAWPNEHEPTDEPFIRVITDATALSREDRRRMMQDRPGNCQAVVVAINEGPLLHLKHDLPQSVFAEAVRFLHAAQRGIELPFNPSAPTVLDVGGYDPIGNGVMTRLLELPILSELVQSQPCQCEDPRICPRKLAWGLLQSEEIRQRVNEILRVVSIHGQAVLFRELWDFVADLALGGSCQADPPTSPWFWRVFHGSSALSHRLQSIVDPSLVVYPRAEAHLWYQDWNSLEIELQDGASFISLSPTVLSSGHPSSWPWLKSQMFFLVRSSSIEQILRDQVDLQLTRALREERTEDIVAAINSYMAYGTIPPSRQMLFLWTDMGVERHGVRPDGQVLLGTVPTSRLKLRRSLAVANHPDKACKLYGARYYLVYEESQFEDGVSFELTPEALNLLRGGRSYRTSNRPHTDLEWHLSRFFSALAANVSRPEQLDVMSLNFDNMVGAVRSYGLSPELGQVEIRGGY